MFYLVSDTVSSTIEYIAISVKLKTEQLDFLKKIDTNTSNAIRIIIERYMDQTRYMNFEKYLPVFAFGLAFIIIGSILQNLYVSLSSIFTGVFLMGFSIYMYNRGRERYDKGD